MTKMLSDTYGCVVANRFGELLDDDADPFDLISEVETEKEKKKKKKKEEDEKKGKQKKPGHKESQKERRLPITADGREAAPVHKTPARIGPLPVTADGKEESKRGVKVSATGEHGRSNPVEYPQEFSISRPPSAADSDIRVRGGYRGRRGPRGGGCYIRNPDNFSLRGKREYDRHNGTGISPEEKRGGRGPWNWGSVEEPSSELMEVTTDAQIKSEEPQIPVEEENQDLAVVEEDGEMVVQVAMEMTLDEWKALQEINRPKAEFNIRKAENAIPSQAKVIHQSKRIDNLKETLEGIEDEGNFLRRSVNDITSLLDINFGSLGRPRRGGRGGTGRGGATRGGMTTLKERAKPTLDRDEDAAPDPDDPEDFPALSAGR